MSASGQGLARPPRSPQPGGRLSLGWSFDGNNVMPGLLTPSWSLGLHPRPDPSLITLNLCVPYWVPLFFLNQMKPPGLPAPQPTLLFMCHRRLLQPSVLPVLWLPNGLFCVRVPCPSGRVMLPTWNGLLPFPPATCDFKRQSIY